MISGGSFLRGVIISITEALVPLLLLRSHCTVFDV